MFNELSLFVSREQERQENVDNVRKKQCFLHQYGYVGAENSVFVQTNRQFNKLVDGRRGEQVELCETILPPS